MTHLDQTAALLLGALGSAAIKAALLLALATVATMALRRRSAAFKHLVWTIGLGATVAVLILPSALPAWRVMPFDLGGQARLTASGARPRLSDPRPLVSDRNVDTVAAIEPAIGTSSGPALVQPTPAQPASFITTHGPSLIRGLAALWLVGAIVLLGRYAWSTVVLHRLCQRAAELENAAGGAIARDITARLLIDSFMGRRVTVLRSDEVELPLTWGIVRPRVVLPGDSIEWSTERLHYVLQHELAHVKRLDACTQLVAGAASAIFWFHPLVWYAVRRMRHERERACDDHVLAQGALASAYAGDLLSLVRTYGHLDRHQAALAMAHRSQFEGRLLALLDPTIERGAVSSRHVALVLIVATVLVVPAAAMQGGQTSPAWPSVPSLSAFLPGPIRTPPTAADAAPAPLTHHREVASKPSIEAAPTVPAALSTQADASDLFAGCFAGSSSHDQHSDGGTLWTATARVGACRYALTAHGEVVFNRDLTGIDGIRGGGDIDITTDIRGDVTHLVGRSTSAGSITYEFSRNGGTADFAADGRAWLAAFLVTLDRDNAFAVDQRLPALLQAGGTARVLDEIDRMHSDHAKSVYLTRLIRTTPLDAVALAGATEAAARMTVDHDVALILTSLAARHELPDSCVRTMLDAASKMQVDHNKLEVLLALANNDRVTAAYTSEYLRIADTLQSPSERRRALSALSRR